jgi:hypothetical protein
LLQKWQKKMGFKAHIPNYRTGQLTLIATSAGKTALQTTALQVRTRL